MKDLSFQVDDLIETPGYVCSRLYIIHGIHLGALGQEGVIELQAIDRAIPDAHGKKQSMFVPVEMLHSGIDSGIFKHTSA